MIMKTNKADQCQCRIIHKNRVNKAYETALNDIEIEKITHFFKVLGDSTRLKILIALEHEEMCVCDLAAYLQISESAVSHQLRTLRQLRLVANRRQGPVLYYRLIDSHISQVTNIAIEHIRE